MAKLQFRVDSKMIEALLNTVEAQHLFRQVENISKLFDLINQSLSQNQHTIALDPHGVLAQLQKGYALLAAV